MSRTSSPEKDNKNKANPSLASFAASTAKRAVLRHAAVAAAQSALASAPAASAGGGSPGIISLATGLLGAFSPIAAVAIIGVSLGAIAYNSLHAPLTDGIEGSRFFQSRVASSEHENGEGSVSSVEFAVDSSNTNGSPDGSGQSTSMLVSGSIAPSPTVPSGDIAETRKEAAQWALRPIAMAAGANLPGAASGAGEAAPSNASRRLSETPLSATVGNGVPIDPAMLARSSSGRLSPMSRQGFSRGTSGAAAVASRGRANAIRGPRSATFQRLHQMNNGLQPTTTMSSAEQASDAQSAQWMGSPANSRVAAAAARAPQAGPAASPGRVPSWLGTSGNGGPADPPAITHPENVTPHQDLIDLAEKLVLAAGLLMLVMMAIAFVNKPGNPNYELIHGILKALATVVVAMSTIVAVIGCVLMADGQTPQGLMFTASAVLMGVLAAQELMPEDEACPKDPGVALKEAAEEQKAELLEQSPAQTGEYAQEALNAPESGGPSTTVQDVMKGGDIPADGNVQIDENTQGAINKLYAKTQESIASGTPKEFGAQLSIGDDGVKVGEISSGDTHGVIVDGEGGENTVALHSHAGQDTLPSGEDVKDRISMTVSGDKAYMVRSSNELMNMDPDVIDQEVKNRATYLAREWAGTPDTPVTGLSEDQAVSFTRQAQVDVYTAHGGWVGEAPITEGNVSSELTPMQGNSMDGQMPGDPGYRYYHQSWTYGSSNAPILDPSDPAYQFQSTTPDGVNVYRLDVQNPDGSPMGYRTVYVDPSNNRFIDMSEVHLKD